jgi:hypothetical protein
MGIRASKGWQPYDASDRKTFHSALCRLLHTEFPGIFGPTISHLFADKIGELYDRFHPPWQWSCNPGPPEAPMVK